EDGEQPDGSARLNDTKPERSLCHLPTVCGKLRRYPCVVVERSVTAGDRSVGATLKGTVSGVPRKCGTARRGFQLYTKLYHYVCQSSLFAKFPRRSAPAYDADLDITERASVELELCERHGAAAASQDYVYLGRK
ncbi:Uncharacterized protein FWK35_00011120, partial [Aphis craccivora]